MPPVFPLAIPVTPDAPVPPAPIVTVSVAERDAAGIVIFKYPPPPPPPPPHLLVRIVVSFRPLPPPPPAPKSWMFTDLAFGGFVQVADPVVAKI
jgi:formin 2